MAADKKQSVIGWKPNKHMFVLHSVDKRKIKHDTIWLNVSERWFKNYGDWKAWKYGSVL